LSSADSLSYLTFSHGLGRRKQVLSKKSPSVGLNFLKRIDTSSRLLTKLVMSDSLHSIARAIRLSLISSLEKWTLFCEIVKNPLHSHGSDSSSFYRKQGVILFQQPASSSPASSSFLACGSLFFFFLAYSLRQASQFMLEFSRNPSLITSSVGVTRILMRRLVTLFSVGLLNLSNSSGSSRLRS